MAYLARFLVFSTVAISFSSSSSQVSSSEVALDDQLDGADALGICHGEKDGCIGGYTSLLQESFSVGHKRAVLATRQDPWQSWQSWWNSGAASTPPKVEDEGSALYLWARHHAILLWIIGSVLCLAGFFFLCLRPAMRTYEERQQIARGGRRRSVLTWIVQNPESAEEELSRVHDQLDTCTYHLAICILVRDLRSLAIGEGKKGVKISRIAFALGLIALTIGIQVAILVCTRDIVTPLQVQDIRDAYDAFESHMYANHTYLSKNGYARGIAGYYNASAFENFDDTAKYNACNIPFSQLPFVSLVLVIWSITCLAQIRSCIELFLSLVVMTETKDNMHDCMTFWRYAMDPADGCAEAKYSPIPSPRDEPADEKEKNIQVITGLTLSVKVFLVICVFLPEFCTTSYLMWLGTRWLTATNDFGNFISNVVGLEFILQLKFLLYFVLGSARNRRDLAHTGVVPPWSRESAGYCVYFSTLLWLLIAAVWVSAYLFEFQTVLPEYKWDVHRVCDSWLASQLSS
jgi:hypothetical protein